MYITNKLVVTVRTKPSSDSKIVDRLTSNIKVDLLRIEGSWAKISFKDNMTGWMLERFLTEETPKPFQVSELKKTVADQTVKIETLEKENRALDLRKKELEERISSLSQESQKFKEKPYRIVMLLAGGGIFLTGCIVTLILLRIGRMDYDIKNLKKRILNKKYQ
jgi:SH3 domain protein